MNPKVLVGTVIYDEKDYMWDRYYDNVKKLDYDNYDICVVDNSSKRNYYRRLQKRTKKDRNTTILHTTRGINSREGFCNSMNKLRETFLAGDYDYLMLIESDLVPSRDVIKRLMKHKVGIVGSIYPIGYANSKTQPIRPCLFSVDPEKKGGTRNLTPDEGFGMFGKGLVQIHGMGFGSTLMERWVMDKFKFWFSLDEPIKHSDVLFYLNYHNEGHRAYVDTDYMIPHFNSNWNEVKDI